MNIRDDQNFTWRKSSYSTNGGGNCVEVGWRVSSYSTNGSASNCVEVGPADVVVGIRDTKNRAGGQLTVSRTTWAAFVRGIAH